LIVANMTRVGVPPNLSIFRIGDEGRLTFVRSYDQTEGGVICLVARALTAASGTSPDIT
jgi:hypothetical protein